jgi:hypothetical protein
MKHRSSRSNVSLASISGRGLAALLACSAPVAAQTAAEVVAEAARALGWDRLAGTRAAVRVEGTARLLGTDATHALLFDGAGRFVERFEGPLPQQSGCDGVTAWTRDWTDTPRELVLGDRADAELAALLRTGRWTAVGPRVALELVELTDDEIVLAFTHADGVVSGTIRLDPATHLPRAATHGSGATPTTWAFADWRDHDGFHFPGRVEYVQEGAPQRLETRTVQHLATVADAEFAPRLAMPDDVRFDPDLPAALEVKRVPTGHLLVRTSLDGADAGWFIFDTGAGTMCVSDAFGRERLAGPVGEIGARGMGGTVKAGFWRADELRLGPLVLEDPVFIGLDLAFLEPHFGVPVAGIIGYELLARCVAELDLAEARIALFDPRTYALPAGGAWEPVQLHGRQPLVRARFEQHEGLFRIDTGAADDTVTFHYQVVQDLELLRGRETQRGMAGGVGGGVATRVGRLASFHLGGHEFTALAASFVVEDKGALSDDHVFGNVGGKLLAPFRLAFDYPGRRLGFVPRTDAAQGE